MKFVIIGAGISGLYCAYMLSTKYNINDIIILEKSNVIGGRIQTKYLKTGEILEMGASKVLSNYKSLLNLIDLLGIKKNLIINTNKPERLHYDIDTIFNNDKINYEIKSKQDMYESDFYNIIEELFIKILDKKFYKIAKNFTLYGLIEKIYGINKADEMRDQFGYVNDFIKQNAIDGIIMFKTAFAKDNYFYSMKNGLSEIIFKLAEYLKNNNINIRLNHKCEDIIKNYDNTFKIIINNNGNFTNITADNVILAIPNFNLIEISYLQKIKYLLDSVINKSLIRVYLRFPLINNKVWFDEINGAITTSTILKQIIPINKKTGILMIYCDGDGADNLNYLTKSDDNQLKNEIILNLRRLFKNVSEPIEIYYKYWFAATTLWKPSYESIILSEKIIKPIENENLFIVGESFSLTQQWSSGALDSVDKFLKLYMINK